MFRPGAVDFCIAIWTQISSYTPIDTYLDLFVSPAIMSAIQTCTVEYSVFYLSTKDQYQTFMHLLTLVDAIQMITHSFGSCIINIPAQ